MACGCKATERIPNNCSTLKVEDLERFQSAYQCVKDNSYFIMVNMTEQDVDDRINVLTAAIVDKQANAASCNYYDNLQTWTREVTTIVLNTPCTI